MDVSFFFFRRKEIDLKQHLPPERLDKRKRGCKAKRMGYTSSNTRDVGHQALRPNYKT